MIPDEELVSRFKGAPITLDSAAHYRGRLERRLLISRCEDCGAWRHPPRPICPNCLSMNVRPAPVSGTGSIHLAIFLHQGPEAEGVDYRTPYSVVTVDLDDAPGARFSSTVVGARNEDIRIGKRVTLDWIERAGMPLPVFRLAEGAGA